MKSYSIVKITFLLFSIFFLYHTEAVAQNNPGPRYGHTMVAYNGKIYLFGGGSSTSLGKTSGQNNVCEVLNDLWAYNIDDFWERIPKEDTPPTRKGHSANVWNGKMVVYGGENSTGTLNDLWTYDFSTMEWAQLTVGGNPPAVSNHSAVIDGNNLVIAGGKDSKNRSLDSCCVIDLNNTEQGFENKPNLPEPLQSGGMFLYNSSYYYVGGIWDDWDASSPGSQPSYSKNVWMLDANSSSWSQVQTSGDAVEVGKFGGVYDQDKNIYYLVGGESYDYNQNKPVPRQTVRIFNPTTKKFEEVDVPVDSITGKPCLEGQVFVNGVCTETGFDPGSDGKINLHKVRKTDEDTTYIYIYGGLNAEGEVSSDFLVLNTITNKITRIKVSTAPTAPANLTATVISSSQINLSWTDNSNDETGFKIEEKIGSGGTWTAKDSVASSVVEYQSLGLSSNTKYYYRVTAYNNAGESSASNEVNATALDVVPTAPTNLTATTVSSSQINLSWTDNSNNETGFEIERKTEQSDLVEHTSVNPNITTFLDDNLSDGTNYTYRILALNSVGNSSYSNEVSGITPLNSPTDLSAEKTIIGFVLLKWKDNSLSEMGFTIERKSGTDSYSKLTDVSANDTSYTDEQVIDGNQYYYKVIAFNEIVSSEYSNEVSILFTDVLDEETIPKEFSLHQNYPNPFNPSTVIGYELPQESYVTLKIYDMLGREVSTLVNELENAGKHKIKFYAEGLGGGIYFYKLIAGEFSKTAKMLLLK
jgi:fibronectin type 3 domain-containing protein